MAVVKRATYANLVEHDLCTAEAQVAKALLGPLIEAVKAKHIAVEALGCEPVGDGKLRHQWVTHAGTRPRRFGRVVMDWKGWAPKRGVGVGMFSGE